MVQALNPPKALVRSVAQHGLAQAQSDPVMTEWGMKDEAIIDDPVYRARILEQLQACHGGGDDRLYQTMYEASMVRDEAMAKTLVNRLNKIRAGTDAMPLRVRTGVSPSRFHSRRPEIRTNARPIGPSQMARCRPTRGAEHVTVVVPPRP